MSAYAPHDRYIAPARRHPELWRLLAGCVLLFAVYLGTILGAAFAIERLLPRATAGIFLDGLQTARGVGPTLVLLGTFVGMAGGAMAAAWIMHRRSPWSLFGDAASLAHHGGRMLILAVAVAAITVPLALITLNTDPNLPIGQWALLLPLTLPLIALQTGAEELAFRGYLQQQLAARFAQTAVWLILPGAIFAAAHMDPATQGANMWPILAVTFGFALVAADLTARTGSLGAAWALHFVNNVQAILLIAIPGPLSALSLRHLQMTSSDPALMPFIILDLAVLGAIWLIYVRRVLPRAA